MTRPLKTASSRPGRRCLSLSSLCSMPEKRSLASPGGWTSFTTSPRGDRASGTSVQHHPEQVGTSIEKVVRRLAGDALGSPGGVDDEQYPVKATKEVRRPQHPRRHRRVEQHEVPALLQTSYCLRDPLILQQRAGVHQNGTGRDDQKSRDDLIPKVLQGLAVAETAGKPDEVRFAYHPVQLRVFEVAVHDSGPPSHAGQGGSEAEADAGPPVARLGTGDDDTNRHPHPQEVARQLLVVTPHRRVGIEQPPGTSVAYGPEPHVNPRFSSKSSPVWSPARAPSALTRRRVRPASRWPAPRVSKRRRPLSASLPLRRWPRRSGAEDYSLPAGLSALRRPQQPVLRRLAACRRGPRLPRRITQRKHSPPGPPAQARRRGIVSVTLARRPYQQPSSGRAVLRTPSARPPSQPGALPRSTSPV